MSVKKLFIGRLQWLSALPLLAIALLLTIIALGTLAGAQDPGATRREALFDFYNRISPKSAQIHAGIHLIEIDRSSIDAVGPWPWPRTILGELVTAAAEAGARAVVIAEPLDAPDPLSPETIGQFWLGGVRDGTLGERAGAQLPNTDEILAQARWRPCQMLLPSPRHASAFDRDAQMPR